MAGQAERDLGDRRRRRVGGGHERVMWPMRTPFQTVFGGVNTNASGVATMESMVTVASPGGTTMVKLVVRPLAAMVTV